MTEPRLDYIGPVPKALTHDRPKSPWWKKLPWPLMAFVGLPTLLAAIYFLIVASPLYVSESRFIVRTAGGGGGPSSFGIALQGVGLGSGQTDAFAVHEYIASTQAIEEVGQRIDLPLVLGRPGADFWARYPRFGESRSVEGLQKAMERFVTVGYDSTTGISTLRVQAFRPIDAQTLSLSLLEGGEALVNRLNERSQSDAVSNARLARDQAQQKLSGIQVQMTSFRNREQVIDPSRTALESSQLIGSLLATVAGLKAERSQISIEAPQSPLLQPLDNRIAAYERQIAAARSEVAGTSSSLAPQVGVFEELTLRRELATEELTQATGALLVAEQEGRRQQLYLERIVSPTLPQKAVEPKRWISVLIVLVGTLLAYGVAWLVWAGVREHRQD